MMFGTCPTAEVTADARPAYGSKEHKELMFRERVFAGVAYDRRHPEVLATDPHVGIGPGEIRGIVRDRAQELGLDADAIFAAARKPLGWGGLSSTGDGTVAGAKTAPLTGDIWADIYGEPPSATSSVGEGGGL